jgi:D-alanine-D-alanine ligase
VEVRALRAEDAPALRALLEATGVFTPVEVAAAMEEIERGSDETSVHGYRFRVADDEGTVLGFTCYGRAWFTEATWDLYWIAVHPARQRGQVGAKLLAEAETAAVAEGGRTMLVDSASKPSYAPAHRFYRRNGYAEVARIPDYYAEGDDKVVYAKRLGPSSRGVAPGPGRR